MAQTLTSVKLSRLVEGKEVNARSDAKKVPIEDLTASLTAHGLFHPLIAREIVDRPGFYEVGDGNRRLRALKKLHKGHYEVPTIVVDGDTDLEEVSLALNVARVNLHPVDEYRRYQHFVEQGQDIANIAQRFGTSEKWVRQRLQLARLAPELLEAWRAGKMDSEQAKALSASPSHPRQIAVWNEAFARKSDGWSARPDQLRKEVIRSHVRQDSAEFKLVGAEAYEAAGGTYSDDLFADQRLILDTDILDRLAEEILQADCKLLREDGWLWAETEVSLRPTNEYELVDHDLVTWATGDERGELATASFIERRRILEAIRSRAIDDPDARAKAGVFVDVEADGSVRRRFFVDRPPEMSEDDGSEEEQGSEDSREPIELGERSESSPVSALGDPQAQQPKINFALRERLSEILTVALSRALARNPKVAMAAVLATLKCEIGSPFSRSPFRIDTHAWEGLAPETPGDYRWERNFDAALETGEFSFQMLAVLVSKTLDLRWPKFDDRQWSDRQRREMVDALWRALGQDADDEIANLFDPEEYFKRLTISQISDVLQIELNYSASLPSGKAALVALAVERAKVAKWLPGELRGSA